ncbi:MAG: VCBS repeat-containing protein, partial [Solirubrobacteraceae bacterium]
GWTTEPEWAAAGDFTGNGVDDLVMCSHSDEYAVALSNGKELGVSGSSVWLHAPCKAGAIVGDFNGDGKEDLAIPNESNTSWTVELSDGTKFGAAGSGTWLSGWAAKPYWVDAGEGTNSQWTGTEAGRWATEPTPDATGAANNRLTGVSCTSSTFCFATAYEIYNGVSYGYGESWNGSEWKIQSGIEPNAGIQFAGVSCTSSTSCTAVGSLTETNGNIVTLAYNWNGSKWTRQTTPDEPATANQFAGVSCTATVCIAVGSDTNDKGVWNFAARS